MQGLISQVFGAAGLVEEADVRPFGGRADVPVEGVDQGRCRHRCRATGRRDRRFDDGDVLGDGCTVLDDGPHEVAGRLRARAHGREAQSRSCLNPRQQLSQLQASDAQIVERAVEGHGKPGGVGMDLGGQPAHQFEDAGGALIACHGFTSRWERAVLGHASTPLGHSGSITGIWAEFTTALLTEPSSMPENPPRALAAHHH